MVERGLAATRSKAQALILAGEVYVDGKRVDKAGQLVDKLKGIEIREAAPGYVSRGGIKLAHALREFKIDVQDCICVDIGASTGGFTDCLLKNGAARVYAIDVGYGQLDPSLRNDERVVVLERTNIRGLDVNLITDPIDLVVIDVSFIGLEKVFPKVDELACHPRGVCHLHLIALIKPQFQVGRAKVGKGGVVRDEAARREAVEAVKAAAGSLGWQFRGVTESPIRGPKGNTEYFAWWLIEPQINLIRTTPIQHFN